MQRNVSGIERAVSVAAGALLIAATRRARSRALTTALGAWLMARGFSGYCPINAVTHRGGRRRDDTRKALGGPRGVHVTESIVLGAPRESVYAFWRSLSNLPRFMTHLERIDVTSDTRSHWVTLGPAGTRIEWDAALINDKRPELIAWRSLPGAEVASAGSVHFRATPEGGTEIRVRLQYDPPAGKVGAWLSALLGEDPAQQIREDLQRLRELFDGAASPTAPAALAGDRLQVQPEVG
jgi:uncharacterized membrane protein